MTPTTPKFCYFQQLLPTALTSKTRRYYWTYRRFSATLLSAEDAASHSAVKRLTRHLNRCPPSAKIALHVPFFGKFGQRRPRDFGGNQQDLAECGGVAPEQYRYLCCRRHRCLVGRRLLMPLLRLWGFFFYSMGRNGWFQWGPEKMEVWMARIKRNGSGVVARRPAAGIQFLVF
ncbi:hypothetical protein HPP92_015535 [Vanilla planifolia]|uniref:Uncharacterized protein n=1 Tax=Vanilla planifolia TaxID=51239 RepID=A0A835UTT0_VANPL|nr:hypothetical protein HPP92_015535 [Vanilla planifolia]